MLKYLHTSLIKIVFNKKNIIISEARKRRKYMFILNTQRSFRIFLKRV